MATKTKPADGSPPAAPKERLVGELTLSRDELYRAVNATWHAQVELGKNPTFAIRNRANYYGATALKLDGAYQDLVEFGMDAVFTVKFFVKEWPKP